MVFEMKENQLKFINHKAPNVTFKLLYPEASENTYVAFDFAKTVFEENFMISSDLITNASFDLIKYKEDNEIKKSFKPIDNLYSFPTRTKFINIDYFLSLVLDRYNKNKEKANKILKDVYDAADFDGNEFLE